MRNNNRRKKPKLNRHTTQIKKILFPVCIVFAILLFSTIFALTNSINEKIISRVKINETKVSNLTINEAYEKTKKDLEERISKNITLKSGEYETTVSLGQLEVQ